MNKSVKPLSVEDGTAETAYGWQVERVEKSGELTMTTVLSETGARNAFNSWKKDMDRYGDQSITLIRLDAVRVETVAANSGGKP